MNSYKNEITQAELRYFLSYCESTGVFTWNVNKSPKARAGSIAGVLNGKGYINLTINSKIYKAHRLAWLYVYGEFPRYGLDHINGNRADNRIKNIREATQLENNQNRKKPINNTTGFIGVSKNKQGKFFSSIMFNGVRKYLGNFFTPEEAYKAYTNAKLDLHKFNPVVRT